MKFPERRRPGAMGFFAANRNRTLWILALCALVPIFYVLSVGPAVWVIVKFRNGGRSAVADTAAAFYRPLSSYVEKNPNTYPSNLLQKYVDFWTRAAD